MTGPEKTRLGRFEVVGELGAGGMGRVVRARDPELGRDVALKMLPEETAGDRERVLRLEREAQVLAGLNHPNIATLYGLERDGERLFLVMELVEGRSLDRWLGGRPMAVERALEVALQLAAGLEAAHERGIVHRDLKSANVMLRDDGTVKVLDFGLAKPVDPGLANEGLSEARTAEAPVTRHGATLGTVGYMSPEQARGEPVDVRTDIWAFGCVLYELLTGGRPFERSSTAETVAAVLGEEPDWGRLPPALPARVRLLLRRCLRKDPRHRLRDIGDARLELAEALAGEAPEEEGARRAPGWTGRILWAATGAAAALLLAAAWLLPGGERSTPPSGPALRLALPLPSGFEISKGEVTTRLAVSPDGTKLAFVDAAGRLWIHRFHEGRTEPVPGVEAAATPVWSPDGRALAYFGSGRLLRLDPDGGAPPRPICAASWEAGSSWGVQDVILLVLLGEAGPVIHSVPAAGGETVPVTALAPGQVAHLWPEFLPDGERFLYLAVEPSPSGVTEHALYVGFLAGGDPVRLGALDSRVLYHPPSGHLLYVAQGTLVARPFDVERLAFTGEPAPLADRLSYFFPTGQAEFSVSTVGGRSVLVSHGGLWESELVWFDRTGERRGALAPPAAFDELTLSPDGRTAAVDVVDPKLGSRDLWLYPLDGGGPRRLTLGPEDERSGVWSPDGVRLVLRSDRHGPPDLWLGPADGSAEAEPLLRLPGALQPEDWAPGGELVAYREHSRSTAEDLWLLPVDGTGERRPYLATSYSEWGARFSPDGRWLAFVSDESGRYEIYVAPVDRPGARRTVSTTGGLSPRWRADGAELYFLTPGREVMAVAMDGFPARPPGVPRRLFILDHPVQAGAWDVSPDGERFLVNLLLEDAVTRPIDVLVDWPSLLRSPAGGGS